MAIRISSVVLYGDSQPDFSKLAAKGWDSALGFRGEVLDRSLVKQFGSLRFRVVRHEFIGHPESEYPTNTEVFVTSAQDDENSPILKGHGAPFSISELFAAIVWLEEEFES